MSFTLPDPTTEFGARVAARLRDERIIWLTTTGADGTPQPNPVWFLWDGASFLIYSLPDAARLEPHQTEPACRAAFRWQWARWRHRRLHWRRPCGSRRTTRERAPRVYRALRQRIDQNFGGPAAFAARYSVPLRVTPTKVRGH